MGHTIEIYHRAEANSLTTKHVRVIGVTGLHLVCTDGVDTFLVSKDDCVSESDWHREYKRCGGETYYDEDGKPIDF